MTISILKPRAGSVNVAHMLDPPRPARSAMSLGRILALLALAATTCGLGWIWGVSISRRATPSAPRPPAPTAPVVPRQPMGPWDEWTRSYPAQLGELRVEATAERPEHARIEVVPQDATSEGGGNSLNLARSLVPLLVGQTVELTLYARAETPAQLAVWINGTNGQYRNLADVARLDLTSAWQRYRLVWTLREGDDYPRLSLGFDCRPATIELEALQLRAIARPVQGDGAIETSFGKCAVEVTPQQSSGDHAR